MLSVTNKSILQCYLLSVIMLIVVMLNVVAPKIVNSLYRCLQRAAPLVLLMKADEGFFLE